MSRSLPEWIGRSDDDPVGALADYARAVLHYDPATGLFIRTVRTGPNVKVGLEAGAIKNGYRFIRLNGRKYAAHRLAWLYIYGVWPPAQIDHINGDTLDNRIGNLRAASFAENAINRRRYSNNRSGFKGVSWHKASSKWRARIYLGGRVHDLGGFDTVEAAAAAYDNKAAALHGPFARTNVERGNG